MGAVAHPGLVAGHQRRSDRDRKGEVAEILVRHQRLEQDLRALLIGCLVVQLEVLLHLGMRVADPAVDERRRGGDRLSSSTWLRPRMWISLNIAFPFAPAEAVGKAG